MIYDSGIDVQDKDANDIIEELKESITTIKPRPRQFTKEQLAKIKTEIPVEPTLTA